MKIRTGRKRSTGKTGRSYILRNIPRQDWEKAKAKARAEDGVQEGALGQGEDVLVELAVPLSPESLDLCPDFAPQSSRGAGGAFRTTGNRLERLRQMLRKDEAGAGQEARPFDHVFKFSDIPGPLMPEETLQGFPGDLFVVLPSIEAQEMIHQERDVL